MWGWLQVRWPQRLTSETPCPRCGVGIRQVSGSSDTVRIKLNPCGHYATADPFTRRLHPSPLVPQA